MRGVRSCLRGGEWPEERVALGDSGALGQCVSVAMKMVVLGSACEGLRERGTVET